MALSRRTGVRFQASIWPGFVDAMTGLLLVLMFVLTIFMVMQFVLQETIKGQGTALDELNLDITQKDAINKLQKIVESDYYETNLDNLAKAREPILDKYNLLNFIDQELNDHINKKKS